MGQTIRVVDSHTGGEPTRIIVTGGPPLGGRAIADQARHFRSEHGAFRRAVITEPRGSDILVGGLLTQPSEPNCAAGVIFFNNVDTLGMCGHGTIGLAVTLLHLGQIQPGDHRIETPVGIVGVTLHDSATVTVTNVPSYRAAKDVPIQLSDGTQCRGDVAWGGNWFFLVREHSQELTLNRVTDLTSYSLAVRDAVHRAGFPEVDHVELFAPSHKPGVDSRNFVLCPGGAYDRSPCGTGTSAKLACLAADGKLPEDTDWIQESIIGSNFRGRYQWVDRERGVIAPQITGSAYVTAESTLVLNPEDPFCWGIGP